MTTEQIKALRKIADLIVETVTEADKNNPAVGAPGGHLYAALMAIGCTYDQFDQIMSGLVRAGKLRKSGDCYHAAVAQ